MPRSAREFDEALRQLAVVGGERGADFTFGDLLIEGAIKRPVGDGSRIVCDGRVIRINAARNDERLRPPRILPRPQEPTAGAAPP